MSNKIMKTLTINGTTYQVQDKRFDALVQAVEQILKNNGLMAPDEMLVIGDDTRVVTSDGQTVYVRGE